MQLLRDDITWDGFEIRGVFNENNGPGMYTSPAHSGYTIRDTIFRDNGMGLHLGASGAHPTLVCRNLFVANNEFTGPGAGNGIFSNKGAEDVLIIQNRFERHNGAGILFADNITGVNQQNVRVGWNRSVKDRTFAAFFATTRVLLTRNVVWARLTDPDPRLREPVSAIFIGARNHQVLVHRNRVRSASGNGIDITNTGAPKLPPAAPTDVHLVKNRVDHARLLGIDVSASGIRQYEVRGNRAFANGRVGLHLGPATDDVLVRDNKAVGNPLDCQDESKGESAADGTAGTENHWERNLGRSALPPSLCSPPPIPNRPSHHGGGEPPKPGKPRDCRCTLPWRL